MDEAAHAGARQRSSTRAKGKVVAAITGALLAASLASCGQAHRENVVHALWYGEQSDGSLASGTTAVTITTPADRGTGDFVVDLSALTEAGAGNVWNATAWSAAAVATLQTATDPRGLTVQFGITESIDGPSAGGLMTTGVMGNLIGQQVSANTTMTGTILPNGGVGPVGGIPEKLRAALRDGIKTVLIPAGQRMSTDPRTGANVDVIEEGERLGIDVREVSSVSEAYRTLVGEPPPEPTANPGPLDAKLTSLLRRGAILALTNLSKPGMKIAKPPAGRLIPAYERMLRGVANTKTQVPQFLAADQVVNAYSMAGLTEREVLGWNAQAEALTNARESAEGRAAVRAQLLRRAQSLSSASQEALASTGAHPTKYIEQLAALPDTLAWAVDAEAVAAWSEQELADADNASTPRDLGQIASDLAQLRYDLDVFLATSLAGMDATGRAPVRNIEPLLDTMDEYAGFLGNASNASMNYYIASRSSSGSQGLTVYDEEFALDLLEVWESKSRDRSMTQAAVVERLSVAISFFVASASLVAGAETINTVPPGDGFMSRVQITQEGLFDQQVQVAAAENARRAELVEGAGLDSSYFMWNSDWGYGMSRATTAQGATDSIRREGLQYMWYENVEAGLLMVMDGIDDSNAP